MRPPALRGRVLRPGGKVGKKKLRGKERVEAGRIKAKGKRLKVEAERTKAKGQKLKVEAERTKAKEKGQREKANRHRGKD